MCRGNTSTNYMSILIILKFYVIDFQAFVLYYRQRQVTKAMNEII